MQDHIIRHFFVRSSEAPGHLLDPPKAVGRVVLPFVVELQVDQPCHMDAGPILHSNVRSYTPLLCASFHSEWVPKGGGWVPRGGGWVPKRGGWVPGGPGGYSGG